MPDLRLPVGIFFVLAGFVLVVQAFVQPALEAGIFIDLWWGIVLLFFGALMWIFGWLAGPVKDVEDSTKP